MKPSKLPELDRTQLNPIQPLERMNHSPHSQSEGFGGNDGIDAWGLEGNPFPIECLPGIAGELVPGTTATWKAFAQLRGLTYPATWSMVQAGILRFCKIDSAKCYVITDNSGIAVEIRRMDGKPFTDKKQYPLIGVKKAWMPGLELLKQATIETSVLISEGATDLMAAIDLYSRYRRCDDGRHSWQPVAMLGAGCKNLHPQAEALLKGRHIRLVPDADPAGDKMADHWTKALRQIGCSVDVVTLPQGTNLTDHLSTLKPSDLFSK